MSGIQSYDSRVAGWRAEGDPWSLPVPMRQVRIKLAGFATLTLLALTLRMPIWSQIALLAATIAIPAAVALHGGRRLLGALLLGHVPRPCGSVPRTAPGARDWRVRPTRSRNA